MEDTSGVHVWLVLSKAMHHLEEQARHSIADTGLGLSGFMALEALLHKGPLTIGAIGEKVFAYQRLDDDGHRPSGEEATGEAGSGPR